MEVSAGSVRMLPLFSVAGEEVGCLPLKCSTKERILSSLDTYYSPVFGPVWQKQVAQQVDWTDVAHRIKGLPSADVLHLQPLESDGFFRIEMQRGLSAVGYAVDQFFCFGNWYLPTQGLTFEAYWAQRPSRMRSTIQRARRRLDQRQSWRVDVLSEPGADLEQAISAFVSVYARSWKQSEPFPNFMPGLIRLACDMGALRFGQLWLEGEVVASQVWVVYGGSASIYKLAYLPGYEKLSVGSVLTAALMEHVINRDHVSEVDYLMGDDPYKQDWMTHRRERVGLVAFDRRRLRGLLAWARHHAGRRLRRWLS